MSGVCRPLVPAGRLAVSEPYQSYMSRSFQVTKDILSGCGSGGEGRTRGAAASGGGSASLFDLGSCPRFRPLQEATC